jgi:glucose/arabinose dehydrogenase
MGSGTARQAAHRLPAKASPVRLALELLEQRDLPSTALPPGFTETSIVSGLSAPTNMTFAPDGRLFTLEQGGAVKLVHSDGTTFTALQLTVDSSGERGLLGIAFDPNYASNHFVYLYYTNPQGGGTATGVHNELDRFFVNDANPQQPTFGSDAPILDLNDLSSATNHNGGGIHFGSDGMLYAGVGENANSANSQTLANLLGKFLRINVAGFTGTRDDATVGHIIPADNPFVGTATGINQLIYALGLRNPFTSAVDPASGQIYINDVGQSSWEEIDQATAGANYGWPYSEGFKKAGDQNTTIGTYKDPLLAYDHSIGDAIVGGVFYHPSTVQFPTQYAGKYFFEDLNGGWIHVFNPAHPGSLTKPDTSQGFATNDANNTDAMLVDPAGSLYYLSRSNGQVLKFSYQKPSINPPHQTVHVGQSATFNAVVAGSGPFNYQWQHLVSGTWTNVGTNSPTFTISSATAADAGKYRVIVSDALGRSTSKTATLQITAQASTGLDAPFALDALFSSGAPDLYQPSGGTRSNTGAGVLAWLEMNFQSWGLF